MTKSALQHKRFKNEIQPPLKSNTSHYYLKYSGNTVVFILLKLKQVLHMVHQPVLSSKNPLSYSLCEIRTLEQFLELTAVVFGWLGTDIFYFI